MARHFRKKNNKKKEKLPTASKVIIQSLGVRGDGIGRSANGDLFFVPYVLAGEEVIAKPIKKKGDGYSCVVVEQKTTSDDRVEPTCPHFTECGGCKLQHMAIDQQNTFKKNIVQVALSKQDLDVDVKPTISVGGLRRRARFVVKKAGNHYVGGFHKAQSHAIAPIKSCEIISDAVWNSFQIVLKSLASFNAPKALDIHVTEGYNGVEIVLYPHGDYDLDLEAREILTVLVKEHKFVGLYCNSKDFVDPVCVLDSLKIKFGSVIVGIPPASFLQPSEKGQFVLTDFIVTTLEENNVKGRIADLFCGSGCFSFPLTKFGSVDAFEGNVIALNLLNKTTFGKGVNGFVRDLELRPLDDEACSAYKTIVLDPPRAGAEAQVQEIAKSTCPLVIYVSCNPIALAKDSVTLVNGGYELESVTPIDQFAYSEHTECIAVFKKS